MNGKKRFLSGIVTVTMLFSLVFTSVEAKESTKIERNPELKLVTEDRIDELVDAIDYNQEYLRAKAGVSDIPIDKELLESCTATLTDAEGNANKLNTYVTVKELGQIQRANEYSNIYSMTVFSDTATKTDSGTAQKYNTMAYGTVTWIDNLGMANELVEVSGGWNPGYKEQLLNRKVRYGANTNSMDTTLSFTTNSNSFHKYANSKMVGWVLFLDTYVEVNGGLLNLYVTSGLFT